MDMLHTSEELVGLSNAAHVAEGVLLIVLAGILFAQAFGYLQKSWQRYLLPGVGLLASITLACFLFVDHAGELGRAWRAITADMQQKQHLYMGSLIGFGSVLEFIAIKRKNKLLRLAFPIAIAVIGLLFLIHPQHGSSDLARKALLIHRIVGSALIISALAQAMAVFKAKSKRVLLTSAAVTLVLSGVLFISYREPMMDMSDTHHNFQTVAPQSHASYTLNLMSGKSYLVSKPTMMVFTIQDQEGNMLKSFDTVHEKKLHLIVVRKDRTNFQHVHPAFDEKSGTFTIEPFTFPTDGEYRVFADFTPSNSPKEPDGLKLTATPYQDVQVGDISKYTPLLLGNDKLDSSVNGFDTNLFLPEGDSPSDGYIAGTTLNIAVGVNKNTQTFKNLQTYLGALGHMVVLSPSLEYIHAHATSEDVANQVGLVTFTVNFPDAGQYKLYLQTQADNQVNTTDYTVTVKPGPSAAKPSNNPSKQNIDHNGH